MASRGFCSETLDSRAQACFANLKLTNSSSGLHLISIIAIERGTRLLKLEGTHSKTEKYKTKTAKWNWCYLSFSQATLLFESSQCHLEPSMTVDITFSLKNIFTLV